MKKLNFLLTAVVALTATSLTAQNSTNKWYVSVGAHATDFTSVRPVFDEFFQTKNWTIVPPLSKISIARSLNKSFAVDGMASIGDVTNNRLYVTTAGVPDTKPTFRDEFFINAGLGLRYKLTNGYLLKETSWFDPYFRIGVNYHKFDYTGGGNDLRFTGTTVAGGKERGANHVYGASVPTSSNGVDYLQYDATGAKVGTAGKNHVAASLGFGVNFWITKKFGINLASDYNHAFDMGKDYIDFFQHSAGITFRFGNSDKDKDGILDKDDKCPLVAGLAKFQGCPDTDGDGIQDSEDTCPTVSGPSENKGCPWGDKDKDGVKDNEDKCVDVSGPAANGGCPWVDSDKDGILDKDDKCPSEAGVAKYQGCPEPKAAEEVNKDFNIFFNTGKSTVKAESMVKIDRAVTIFKEALTNNPNATFYIDGYTDNKGKEKANVSLSQRRSAEVVRLLTKAGIPNTMLRPRGFGPASPVATNDTEEGRQANRRVIATTTQDATGTFQQFLAAPVKAVKKAVKKMLKK